MYRKKEKTNRFAGWAAMLLLSIVLVGFSGCGKRNAAVLETLPAVGGAANGVSPETSAFGTEGGAVLDQEPQEPETESRLQVHVCGAVKEPGVYSLSAGSRVFEAVDAAGGMTADAARDYLNLADAVYDGAKVRVPFLSELSEGETYGPAGAFGVTGNQDAPSGGTDGLVDLNQADRETLMTLPGIGEAKAEAILSWREEHGPFGKPEDIMQVPGIKEAAYEKLKDKVTAGNEKTKG